MDQLLSLKSIPIGSILTRPESEDKRLLAGVKALSSGLNKLISAESTGAFIRGIEKSYDLPLGSAPKVAFSVLLITLGERSLAQLPALFSTELKIANDKAQQMAREIERDLFAPVALELNQYLAKQKKLATPPQPSPGLRPAGTPRRSPLQPTATPGESRFPRTPAPMPNILNLKDKRQPPAPPPIPR